MGKNLSGKELGEGLSQRKDGTYLGRYTDRLGNRKCLYDPNLNNLRIRLEEAKALDLLELNVVDDTVTLDQWFSRWFAEYKVPVLRDSSLNYYENLYNNHISPELGKQRLVEITNLKVQALVNKLDKNGYGFETINKTKLILGDMFSKAYINELVRKNPVRGVRIKEKVKQAPKFLTLQEQQDFLNCSLGHWYHNLVVVLLNTGLRIGEAAALTERDIDFKKNCIYITKTLVYTEDRSKDNHNKAFFLGPPKTDTSNRIVPMTRQCRDALIKQINQAKFIRHKFPDAVKEEFKDTLFRNEAGGCICPQNMIDYIRKICSEINKMRDELDYIENFSSHTFRHTFASNLLNNGSNDIDLKTLQSLLGHATLQMTTDLYSHIFQSTVEDSIDKLSESMDKIFQSNETESSNDMTDFISLMDRAG